MGDRLQPRAVCNYCAGSRGAWHPPSFSCMSYSQRRLSVPSRSVRVLKVSVAGGFGFLSGVFMPVSWRRAWHPTVPSSLPRQGCARLCVLSLGVFFFLLFWSVYSMRQFMLIRALFFFLLTAASEEDERTVFFLFSHVAAMKFALSLRS